MRPQEIIRAWKDEAYRSGLSETERAMLPEHPSGAIELSDIELGLAAGAATERLGSIGCECGSLTRPSCVCSIGCSLLCPPATFHPFCTVGCTGTIQV